MRNPPDELHEFLSAFGASIALGLVLLGLSLVVNAIVGAVSLPRTGGRTDGPR